MAEAVNKIEDVPGVGLATAQKLRAAGFHTLESIAVASGRELAEMAGLTEERAREFSKRAREMLNLNFLTAEELLTRRQNIARLTTGCKSLDDLLGGGVETQGILELIGQYGVGKTQICLALCVFVQQPVEMGGLEGSALYLDTEGTFRPERIIEIARGREIPTETILKNIIVARAFNSDHQVLIAEKLDEIIQEKNIKLVIVDSIISHFRAEYLGRESLPTRQQRLNQHLHKLLRMAEVFNIPVVVTNQVVASPDAFFGPPNKPAGGHILAHLSTNRVFLRKGKRYTRIARIIDSPYLPEGECIFKITEKGVEDVPP
ncbi:MAG: DNA repair and recombination protein RadA [Candidatus Bathyarchaeota archaeon]|nr:DNA repair and recombination protein RadA [Candidatus Bathyarchaeota archaeon]